MLARLILFVGAVATANAASCDNSCSGHGSCNIKGVCECYDGWGVGLSHDSGDCSDRICPYEIAWVDRPNANGEHHKYAECAGAGICDRTTGECQCFPGFEGQGCRRTSCPNGCSGHGTCKFIEDMGYSTVPADYYSSSSSKPAMHTFMPQTLKTFNNYYCWDKTKTTGCVCDPGYGDFDCSKVTCPYATDVMAVRTDLNLAAMNQKQSIFFVNDLQKDASDSTTMNGKSFALTFKSKLNETFTTRPLVVDTSSAADFADFLLNIQFELMLLPAKVIDKVKVTGSLISSTTSTSVATGAPVYFLKDGITPMTVTAVSGPTDPCSTAGTCNVWPPAFSSGAATNVVGLNTDASIQTVADACVTDIVTGVVTCATCLGSACATGVKVTAVSSFGFYLDIEFTGDNVQGPQNLMSVKAYSCGDGCTPQLTGLSLRPESMVVLETQKSDLNSYECGRRGKCDYTTGMCTCFSGYTGASCNIITALV